MANLKHTCKYYCYIHIELNALASWTQKPN